VKNGALSTVLPTALAVLLFSTIVNAEGHKRVGAVELDRSDRYLIHSAQVRDLFRVDVLRPLGYSQSEQSYPVVYVTDSNYLLMSAAATYLAQATGEYPKMIIVGIGWDVPSITRIRVRDLLPPCNEAYLLRQSMAKSECGHAKNFSAFIEKELQPFILENYRAKDDSTLVGYSYGGVFALYTLFNHTDLFDRYLIGSASMNWDDGYVFRAEESYAKNHSDLDKTVYFSAGSLEVEGEVPNTELMVERLRKRKYPGLQLSTEVLRDETHMTSINSFVMRGLRYVFQKETADSR